MWHPDPDRLALAALPAEHREPAIEEHLASCPLCRGYVTSLRRTVDLALAGGVDVLDDAERPPDRVWRAITDELDIVPDQPPAPAASHPVPGPVEIHRHRRARWRRLAVPVAAAVLGVAAGLGIGAVLTAPPEATVVARLGPVGSLAPAGSGTVELVGRTGERAMVVRLAGVTDSAGGQYLEVWLMDRAGRRLVSLGVLARDGDGYRGQFTVPADLPMDDFGVIDVSAERWDGDPGHSTVSLLRGDLT